MIEEKITQIKAYFKELPKNQKVIKDLDYLTFLATFVPVPGYQQAAQIVNKLFSDHNLNILMAELRESIYETNKRIALSENDIEKIQSMAATVSAVSELEEKLDLIIEQAHREFPSEFMVETENWSTQTIINQIINADFTSVYANNNSHNHLEDVEINSPRTHLRATNHSSNYLQGTNFRDSEGTISVSGITQQGDNEFTGNSIGFGEGGTLIFGPPENEITGECPNCRNIIVADKNKLRANSPIQCSQCGGRFLAKLP